MEKWIIWEKAEMGNEMKATIEDNLITIYDINMIEILSIYVDDDEIMERIHFELGNKDTINYFETDKLFRILLSKNSIDSFTLFGRIDVKGRYQYRRTIELLDEAMNRLSCFNILQVCYGDSNRCIGGRVDVPEGVPVMGDNYMYIYYKDDGELLHKKKIHKYLREFFFTNEIKYFPLGDFYIITDCVDLHMRILFEHHLSFPEDDIVK